MRGAGAGGHPFAIMSSSSSEDEDEARRLAAAVGDVSTLQKQNAQLGTAPKKSLRQARGGGSGGGSGSGGGASHEHDPQFGKHATKVLHRLLGDQLVVEQGVWAPPTGGGQKRKRRRVTEAAGTSSADDDGSDNGETDGGSNRRSSDSQLDDTVDNTLSGSLTAMTAPTAVLDLAVCAGKGRDEQLRFRDDEVFGLFSPTVADTLRAEHARAKAAKQVRSDARSATASGKAAKKRGAGGADASSLSSSSDDSDEDMDPRLLEVAVSGGFIASGSVGTNPLAKATAALAAKRAAAAAQPAPPAPAVAASVGAGESHHLGSSTMTLHGQRKQFADDDQPTAEPPSTTCATRKPPTATTSAASTGNTATKAKKTKKTTKAKKTKSKSVDGSPRPAAKPRQGKPAAPILLDVV
eukprot:m.491275 g.491275  ORF g.491275 m.491275 type:complete len:409 (+) comp29580_c0_seq1:183-1409(+)